MSEARYSTTYYTNFFVLRMAVTINGQAAEIGFSENKQLALNCRYPNTKYLSLTIPEWEVFLSKYGVSHISNFWCADVPLFQVSFSSGDDLRVFLHSQQEMEIDLARGLAGPAMKCAEDMRCGVVTGLFLVVPDVERKDAQITRVTDDNCSRCLVEWKESEVFEFGSTFQAHLTSPRQSSAVTEGLSLRLLVSELSDVVDWFSLGVTLGVPHSQLLTVEANHRGQIERCRTEMLNWWVNNEEQPTWSAVVRALEGIRSRGLAEKIARKYEVHVHQTSVSTATDTHPTHMTAAGSQTVPVQLPANIQQVYSSLEERDEELIRISESLPAAKKIKMDTSRICTQVKKQLTVARASTETLVTERDAAKRQLEVEDGELRFLKRLRKIEKRNEELQAVIAKKEEKIAQLREQLADKESELDQAKEEVQRLTKELQQKTVELVEKSTQVREMERARADMERERKQANMMMLMQLCAMNSKQGLESQLERVTSTELDTLKQAVKEKKEEIGRLSSQLEAKETEKQKLLSQVERQSQQEEDELVQLTAEVCELRSHLMEAEDGRMRAEVELEDLKSRKSVVNQPAPQNCKAVGRGLQYGETNQIAEFQVHLIDANGEPCVERQEVRAELKSLVDGRITQAKVSHQTRSVGSYSVSYQPSIRGRHELSVLVNDVAIRGSPFRVYVQQPPQLMGQPVRVIRGLQLSSPLRATLSSNGQLIVSHFSAFSGRISVFDGQGELVRRIDPLEQQHSRVELDPSGVAIDDSGMMYVCDGNAHKLFKLSSTGKVLESVDGRGSGPRQFDYPDGIALRDNRLYICDVNNHRIQIFSCDLNFINSFGSYGSGEGEFSGPRDIASDQEGNMYVVEHGNHRVQVFSPSGTFLRTFSKSGRGSGELSEPLGIHVDHNIVYITDWGNHRISTFTTLGEFITSFGRRGSEEGEFSGPVGITMDCDGFHYVCDKGNHRIQVF